VRYGESGVSRETLMNQHSEELARTEANVLVKTLDLAIGVRVPASASFLGRANGRLFLPPLLWFGSSQLTLKINSYFLTVFVKDVKGLSVVRVF
jgi:hypothetical protein